MAIASTRLASQARTPLGDADSADQEREQSHQPQIAVEPVETAAQDGLRLPVGLDTIPGPSIELLAQPCRCLIEVEADRQLNERLVAHEVAERLQTAAVEGVEIEEDGGPDAECTGNAIGLRQRDAGNRNLAAADAQRITDLEAETLEQLGPDQGAALQQGGQRSLARRGRDHRAVLIEQLELDIAIEGEATVDGAELHQSAAGAARSPGGGLTTRHQGDRLAQNRALGAEPVDAGEHVVFGRAARAHSDVGGEQRLGFSANGGVEAIAESGDRDDAGHADCQAQQPGQNPVRGAAQLPAQVVSEQRCAQPGSGIAARPAAIRRHAAGRLREGPGGRRAPPPHRRESP